ncbi:hypothetical protein [Candidatus Liberibacter sp.]|nr:hypothetical protein [Candidatus Liberibacter sp.]MBA5723640.1 hypothetical protein [Candidatus Liberibacter sp.]
MSDTINSYSLSPVNNNQAPSDVINNSVYQQVAEIISIVVSIAMRWRDG